MEERNVGTKGKSPKQGLTVALTSQTRPNLISVKVPNKN